MVSLTVCLVVLLVVLVASWLACRWVWFCCCAHNATRQRRQSAHLSRCVSVLPLLLLLFLLLQLCRPEAQAKAEEGWGGTHIRQHLPDLHHRAATATGAGVCACVCCASVLAQKQNTH